MLLNVFNGDCAYERFLTSKLPGETLVWRENYLAGEWENPPEIRAFCQRRSAVLHQLDPQKSELEIAGELERMHGVLSNLGGRDTLILWFDFCPFDRMMLSWILTFLDRLPILPHIRLIAKDVIWNTEDFVRFQDDFLILERPHLHYAAAEWLRVGNGGCKETLLDKLLFPTVSGLDQNEDI